jgi:hypothetical protein
LGGKNNAIYRDTNKGQARRQHSATSTPSNANNDIKELVKAIQQEEVKN